MEWKKEGNRRLRKRIVIVIMVVLAASMLISTLISYIYFERIVRNRVLTDEHAKLQQVSQQMEVQVEDIHNLAISIVADENMQRAMTEDRTLSAFDKIKKTDTIMKRLQFFGGLRLFLLGSFIEMDSGEVFSSSGIHENYVTTKLSIPEIMEFKEHPEWRFSNPYEGTDTWERQGLFCYCIDIRDVYDTARAKGKLYMEISQDYVLGPLLQYVKEYKNVCLVGHNDANLYESSEEYSVHKLLEKYPEYEDTGTYEINEGYLVIQKIEGTDWKICGLVTKRFLWENSNYVLRFFFLSFVLSIISIWIVVSKFLGEVISPISYLSEKMSQNNYENLKKLEVIQTKDEIQTLYECYNNMIAVIHAGINERIRYEKTQKEMEYEIMLSQIHPHYLYNVLNTVVYLAAAGKNKEVVRISQALIFSLQETLKFGENNIETSIRKELELTKSYLDIQHFRYPDLFEVEIDCKEEYMDYQIPKTSIQPLVENAILHGILPLEEKGTVWVSIERCSEYLRIFVEDNGVGISERRLEMFEHGEKFIDDINGRIHIGVSNVRDRIRYIYGEPYGMQIERRKSQGTRVILTLPLKKEL